MTARRAPLNRKFFSFARRREVAVPDEKEREQEADTPSTYEVPAGGSDEEPDEEGGD